MHTYSHLVQTAWLRQAMRGRGIDVPRSFVLGSFMPDIPLMLLTAARLVSLWQSDSPDRILFGHEYDALYFGDPLWIVSHSAMHAPPLVLAGILTGFLLAQRRNRKTWAAIGWFWAGCGIHSVLDIATHTYDGPLLLFPFDWQLRFESPVSYWDPRAHAYIVTPIEHGVDLLAGAALAWTAWQRRLHSGSQSSQTDQNG